MTTALVDVIAKRQDLKQFEELHWEGTFEDYLQLVKENPRIPRSAFQRLYDMLISYGYEEYTETKKKIVHYNFFDDPRDGGRDAVFGLDIPLSKLVHVIKAAAFRYGAEKRILLLHGPVGSSANERATDAGVVAGEFVGTVDVAARPTLCRR